MSAPIETAILEACSKFRLQRAPRNISGTAGSVLGRGAGNAVEFHDFRDYVAGDDPRHVDWAVYARTGELTVRIFREEVHPELDILLDTSASMGLDDGRKAQLCRELAGFFSTSGSQGGCSTRAHAVGDSVARIDDWDKITFDGNNRLLSEGASLAPRLVRRGAVTCLISDFLDTVDPLVTLRALAARSSTLFVVFLLGPWESDPTTGPLHVLEDAETGEDLNSVLSEEVVRRYLRRLNGIRERIAGACRQTGAHFCEVKAQSSLLDTLAGDLLPRGWVVPT